MFARCTVVEGQPEQLDQAIEVTKQQVVPQGREMPGFKGLISFVDRDSGQSMTFTLWESEEARSASAARANEIRSDVVQQVGGTVVAVENYELAVDVRED